MRPHLKWPAHIEFARILTRVFDKLVDGLERDRRRHDQSVRVDLRARDHLQIVRLEVGVGFAKERGKRQRIGGDQVTVWRRLDQLVNHDDAVGTGAVFDDHVLPELLGQELGHHAREEIDRRTRLRPAHQRNRPHGIILRERKRCQREQQQCRCNGADMHERFVHPHGYAAALTSNW